MLELLNREPFERFYLENEASSVNFQTHYVVLSN